MVRRSLSRLAVVIVAAIAAAPSSANAALPDVSKTLFEETFTTPQWKAFQIRVDGSYVGMRWTIPEANEMVSVGMSAYHADGSFFKNFTWTAGWYQDSHYHDVSLPAGMELHEERQDRVYTTTYDVGVYDRLLAGPPAPQTLTIVVWAMGDVQNGLRVRIGTGGDARLGAPSTGTGTFMTPKDFEAPIKAGRQASLEPSEDRPYGFGPNARATVGASTTVEITGDAILGTFHAFSFAGETGAQANHMEIASDAGVYRNCAKDLCQFWGTDSFWGIGGAGTYTFSQTGAGAGIGHFADSMLLALDVVWPTAAPV